MSGTLNNYGFGKEGVNLVKSPLQLADGEATQLQNAELVPDQATGGEGSLSKRGGLAALTSALAGAVTGMISLPLQTTYVRTLYAFANGQESSYTAYKSTDGVTWTGTTAPTAHRTIAKLVTPQEIDAAIRPVGVRTLLLYPGNSYTRSTTAPPLSYFDGTNTGDVTNMPRSAATNNSGFGTITDLLVANGRLYIAVVEPVSSGDPAGAVFELNLDTGLMRQIANAFGPGTNQVTGGGPTCLAWYQGKLWAGVADPSSLTSTHNGKLVSCYPDIDTSWSTEGSAFAGVPYSLCEFLGDLYIGCATEENLAGYEGNVTKRAASSGAYTRAYTGLEAGGGRVASLCVFDSAIYGVEYHNDATDRIHVKKSTDGASWSTDLDLDATIVVAGTPQLPGNLIVFNSKLYLTLRTTSDSTENGYLFERTTAGVWTARLSNKGLLGPMAILTERS